jgi:hypothetical protein
LVSTLRRFADMGKALIKTTVAAPTRRGHTSLCLSGCNVRSLPVEQE